MTNQPYLKKHYANFPGKLLPSTCELITIEHRSIESITEIRRRALDSAPVVCQFVEPAATTGDGTNEMCWLKIATGDVDRAGDTLEMSGVELTNFARNPQLLWMHGLSGLPISTIGRIHRIVGLENALYALAEYAREAMHPFATQVYQLDRLGFLPANSIGFHPIEWEKNEFGGIHFLKWELIECSKVELPMNPFAINDGFPNRESAKRTVGELATWLGL